MGGGLHCSRALFTSPLPRGYFLRSCTHAGGTANIQRWFPDYKGLAAGFTVMGVGEEKEKEGRVLGRGRCCTGGLSSGNLGAPRPPQASGR
jgi:hypothetical protein